MGFKNVGRVWSPESLQEYLEKRKVPSWIKSVTMHHTWSPNLANRPNGFKIQHIRNIANYYSKPKSRGGKLGWSSGPHLFTDEDEIFGMCDFANKGIHARSFNSSSLGIEVLGNYDKESPFSGRGLKCWKTAGETVRVLLNWLDLPKKTQTIKFHREDPRTSKTCPGVKVKKDWFLELIPDQISHQVEVPFEKPDVGINWNQWHFAGETWCVPLLDFLIAKGLSTDFIVENLKASRGKLYFQDDLIEGGFYVGKGDLPKPNERTWAPVMDLLAIIDKNSK